jgi:ABC-type sugar transport system substrate-binding protein
MTPSPRRPATTALRLALPLLSALLTLSAQAARTKAVAPAAPAPSPAPAPQAPRLRVTLLAFGNPPAFWDVLIPVTQEAARQLDIDLEVLNAKGDHLAMVANAQAVSQRPSKPDYVIIDNQKGTGGRQLEPLAAAGIPTLLILNVFDGPDAERYGRPREKLPGFLGTLEPDNQDAGHALALRLADAGKAAGFKPPLRLLGISGAKATISVIARDDGLEQALDERQDLVLAQVVHSNWQREKARKQIAGLLRRWPDTKLIWAANDPMALGAMDALKERGQTPGKDVLLTGLNWSTEALRLVQGGELVASAGGHFLTGAWALVLLRDHHDGRDFAAEGTEIRFPMGLIDRANVETYLGAFGKQEWARIDFAKFCKSRNPAVEKYEFTLQRLLERAR